MKSIGSFRWYVVAVLLFLVSVINFGDRAVLGLVAPILSKTYHLTPATIGWILSAFGFGYVFVQLFASATIVRKLQPKLLIVVAGVVWSIFLGGTIFAVSAATFFVFRLLFGMSEGTNWMSSQTLISRWFGKHETQTAFNVMWAGISVSSIAVPPIAVALVHNFSWRAPFLLLAVVGVVFAILFAYLVTEFPETNRFVGKGERDFIVQNRLVEEPSKHHAYKWGTILTSSSIWWAAIGSFASSYTLYMLQGWLPTYLTNYRHIEYAKVGWLTMLPFVAGALGSILGLLSDRLSRRGFMYVGRTVLPAISGILAGVCLVSIAMLDSLGWIIAFMAITSFFTQAANGMLGATAIDICPQEPHMGAQVVIGIGSINSIVAPLITGYIVNGTHSFFAAFLVAGGLALVIGLLLVAFFRVRPVAYNAPSSDLAASI